MIFLNLWDISLGCDYC